MALPKPNRRVAEYSPEAVNRRIEQTTQLSIDYHRKYPEEIPNRLDALDREWDVERTLEANASTLILVGLGLGLGVNRKFLALPIVAGSFLLQHALQGWCPPVSLLRRWGWRTQNEIEGERAVLQGIQDGFH